MALAISSNVTIAWTVLTQIARNAAASRTTHAGGHDLHSLHQRVREEHGPGQGITELRAGLRVGRDPALGSSSDAPVAARGPGSEQPRLARSDHRAVCQVTGLFDFEGHVCLMCGWPPICKSFFA
jgi:hypothetical protein